MDSMEAGNHQSCPVIAKWTRDLARARFQKQAIENFAFDDALDEMGEAAATMLRRASALLIEKSADSAERIEKNIENLRANCSGHLIGVYTADSTKKICPSLAITDPQRVQMADVQTRHPETTL